MDRLPKQLPAPSPEAILAMMNSPASPPHTGVSQPETWLWCTSSQPHPCHETLGPFPMHPFSASLFSPSSQTAWPCPPLHSLRSPGTPHPCGVRAPPFLPPLPSALHVHSPDSGGAMMKAQSRKVWALLSPCGQSVGLGSPSDNQRETLHPTRCGAPLSSSWLLSLQIAGDLGSFSLPLHKPPPRSPSLLPTCPCLPSSSSPAL